MKKTIIFLLLFSNIVLPMGPAVCSKICSLTEGFVALNTSKYIDKIRCLLKGQSHENVFDITV
jgi:hypothetical protein